ncbi:MAG: DUF4404 family protein [Acidimicrobiales bacterium]
MPDIDEASTLLVAVAEVPSVERLAPVVALARLTGWRLEFVHVVSPPALEATTGGDLDLSAAAPVLSEVADRLRAEGVDAVAHRVTGPTIDTLLTTADERGAAMIVIMARTHERSGRLLLGSTTASLIKATDRPVLVLPLDDDRAEGGYRSSLDRLLDRVEREDADGLDELREVASARLADDVDDEQAQRLDKRLASILHRFETDHPTLVRAINDVSYYLSGMGI